MRSLVWVVLVGLGLSLGSVAQPVGFGVGGFLLGWLTLDLEPLNEVLEATGYPALGESILMMGGGGSGGVTHGLSLGGLGFGGSVDSMQGTRSVELEIGFGGVVLEVVEPLTDRLLVGIGTTLGGGSVTLTSRARLAEDVHDALATPALTQLNASFIGGMGTVRLQAKIADWLWIEGWAAYLVGFPDRWQDNERPLAGPAVPARGPFLGLRFTVGNVGPLPSPTAVRDPAEPDGDHQIPPADAHPTEESSPADPLQQALPPADEG